MKLAREPHSLGGANARELAQRPMKFPCHRLDSSRVAEFYHLDPPPSNQPGVTLGFAQPVLHYCRIGPKCFSRLAEGLQGGLGRVGRGPGPRVNDVELAKQPGNLAAKRLHGWFRTFMAYRQLLE